MCAILQLLSAPSNPMTNCKLFKRSHVEASNVINVPECNKGPKYNKNLVLNVIKVLNVIWIWS